MSKYWLHRISHEWDVSYALLKKGYLSLGWKYMTGHRVLDAIDEADFNKICGEKDILHRRSRWAIWNFAHFDVGDTVVVPRFDGMFGIYEVLEKARPICELEFTTLISETGRTLELIDDHLESNDQEIIDIGFICKVRPIVECVSRSEFSDAHLISRMKIRQTNVEISDISKSVEKAKAAAESNAPLNFYNNTITEMSKILLNKIESDLSPEKVEKLVKLYFEKSGATYSYVPGKNQSDKKDGADADVIAVFEPLKVVFYVQVKKHSGTTSSWAVNQINKYLEQMEDMGDDCTYIPWVITTADEFSDEARSMVKKIADERHIFIRLINGMEFAKMLIDNGIRNVNELK